MEKMEKGKKHNSRLNARFVLLLSCALILVMMFTFGVTLAYFGGKSQGYTADFVLKAGIDFKENQEGTDYQKLTFDSNVLVPGTVINSTCLITITSGTEDVANTAIDGLLRVNLNLSGNMAKFVNMTYSDTAPIYVFKGTTAEDMVEANKVARLVKAGDGNFYLVSTTTSSIGDATLLYEIPCTENNGEVSLIFGLTFEVSNVSIDGNDTIFDNYQSGGTAEFTADFIVIQSDFYSTSTDPLPKNYKNAKSIFDDPAVLGN